MRRSPLAWILLAVYLLLIAYATLYPLSGWRDPGASAFSFLDAPWPRYLTTFDLVVNVVGYLPWGFLWMVALPPRLAPWARAASAVGTATLLSILLEAGQSYLPARFDSKVDVLCNAAGAALGAVLAYSLAPRLLHAGPLKRLRSEAFLPGTAVDLGLVLLGLWLFVQLNPVMLLFGAGDLRDWLLPHEGSAHEPGFFVRTEAFVAAANLVAVALVFSELVPRRGVRRKLIGLVAAALAIKTGATAVIMRADDVLAWLTPGAELGLALGLAVALAAVALPRTGWLAIAAVLLMGATVLVNLAPANPYLAATLQVWQQGHFLNFNGLTRLVSALWPFVALGYLIFVASRRGQDPQG